MLQQHLDEFTALCKKHELTTLGIPITLEKITAKWQSCIDAESAALPKVYLPAEWIFTTDPEDRGVSEKWFADPKYYDAAREADRGREADQHQPALEKGLRGCTSTAAWAGSSRASRASTATAGTSRTWRYPQELLGKKHLYLYFRGVNEQAWVYVNGELAFERSYASTGKGVGELAGAPFSFDAKKWLKPGATNRIAVRVTHVAGLGGISLPAMLIGTDEECSWEELDAYRF